MAETHKSKYKKPENTKPKYRKDIKDYTVDDKDGKLNPYTTGEKQKNVLRKTDKEFVDTGDLYVNYNADDRLYKDVEEGEYDPKHAAKVLKKRQDADEKLSKDQIKDKIENLTREGKERFIREYISRKIKRSLHEQTDPTTEDPNAAPVEDPMVAPVDPTAPTEDPAAPAPADATAPESAPAAETPAQTEPPKPPEQILGTSLQEKNVYDRVGSIVDVINIALENSKEEPKAVAEFYEFLINDLIKNRRNFFKSQK